MLEIPMSKEDLKKLGALLSNITGAIPELAKRTEFSLSYLPEFFKGRFNVTESNQKIITEAVNLILEQKKKGEDHSNSINQISKNK